MGAVERDERRRNRPSTGVFWGHTGLKPVFETGPGGFTDGETIHGRVFWGQTGLYEASNRALKRMITPL